MFREVARALYLPTAGLCVTAILSGCAAAKNPSTSGGSGGTGGTGGSPIDGSAADGPSVDAGADAAPAPIRTPLIDMGSTTYLGFSGGLYPEGSNALPSAHALEGAAR